MRTLQLSAAQASTRTPAPVLSNLIWKAPGLALRHTSTAASRPRGHPHTRRCTTVASYDRNGGPGPRRGPSSPRPRRSQQDIKIVVREYAVPAIGVFALATILAPAIGAIAFGAFSVAIAVAAAVAAFSLSWLLVPIIIMFGGLPLLFGGGMFASLLAGLTGALLIPTMLQFGVLCGALFLGIQFARSLWFPDDADDEEEDIDARNAVVDVSATTIDLEREMAAEAAQRAAELREFDELLRQRERFQRGGDGRY